MIRALLPIAVAVAITTCGPTMPPDPGTVNELKLTGSSDERPIALASFTCTGSRRPSCTAT